MVRAFQAIVAGFDQGTRYFGPFVVANLVTTVLSIPLLVLAIMLGSATGSWWILLLTAILLIAVLPCPASAGLQNLAHGYAHAVPLVGLSDIRPGYREYRTLALKTWLVSIVGTIVILGNMAFYLTLTGPVAGVLRVLWVYVMAIWLGAQMYLYPLLIEQQVKRVFLIYRNALLMSFTRAVFTVIVAAVWLLILAVGFVTGLAGLFGLGIAAAIQQNATAVLLLTFNDGATVEK